MKYAQRARELRKVIEGTVQILDDTEALKVIRTLQMPAGSHITGNMEPGIRSITLGKGVDPRSIRNPRMGAA